MANTFEPVVDALDGTSLPPSYFLRRLTNADRTALLELASRRHYQRGEFVFESGSPGNNVYILEEGRAKVFKLAESRKEIILWFCFPGEIFGLAEISAGGGNREVFAQVCTPALVHCVSREAFVSFLATHPDTAARVMDLLACRMRTLGEMLLNLASDDVRTRLIKLLTRLCARYGQRENGIHYLEIPLTHQDIADMIGTSRQTVTSEINHLKRLGLLDTAGHRVVIQERLLNDPYLPIGNKAMPPCKLAIAAIPEEIDVVLETILAVLLLVSVYVLIYFRLMVRFHHARVNPKKERTFLAVLSVPPYRNLDGRGSISPGAGGIRCWSWR